MENLEQLAEQITDEQIAFMRNFAQTDQGAREMAELMIKKFEALSIQHEGKLRVMYECYALALKHLLTKF